MWYLLFDTFPLLTYTTHMATMEDKRKNLTTVQKNFGIEYLKDPSDGGAAYLRANPKLRNKKSASVAASKLLKMPKMQEFLKEKAEDMMGPVQARILKNVEFWLQIRDDTEASTRDRMKASENMAKYMQMFVERKEVSVEGQVQIVDNIPNA